MDLRSRSKRTALHDAAEYGTFNEVARALSPKSVNQQTSKGETPLHLATAKKRWWAIRELLYRHANPNIQDILGNTPVHNAVRTKDIAILLMLFSANGDVNLKNKKGESAFHLALKNGYTTVVKVMLDRRLVDVNERDAKGWTPLHEAADGGYAGIAKLLIEAKAEISVLTSDGLSPLQLAVNRHHEGRIMLLLGYKDCEICLDVLELSRFPSKGHLLTHHLCQQCVATIGCPSEKCNTLLRWSDINGVADEQTSSRYDEMRALRVAQSDPNFRWCTNPNCKSGQIVSNGAACSFFICHRCNFYSCFSCRTPFHPGMSCAQYRAHISQPDPKTKLWLDTNTMTCAGCGRWCQKTEGCDHMTCKCGDEWCWRCGASYQEIRQSGNHMHKKGCVHYREYLPRR